MVNKQDPIIERIAAIFWENFKEAAKREGCAKIEGGRPEYICFTDDATLVVYGDASIGGEYNIWIRAPNAGGEWYANVEISRSEDEIVIKRHYHVDGRAYSKHAWEALAKLLQLVAATATSARDRAYEEAKRQAPDLLGLFVEEFWKAFDEEAKKDGIRRVEGERGPRYVYIDGNRMYEVRGQRDGIVYRIWIEEPNRHTLEGVALVEAFYYEDRGEIGIKYSITAEGEIGMWELKDLIKLAHKVISTAEVARERAYRAAKRQIPQGAKQ